MNGMNIAADVCTIILAGGHSRRMGAPKHTLIWQGDTFLAALRKKAEQIGDTLISSRFDIPGCDCVLDQFGDIGPLGGIASCMALRAYTLYLVVAVDTPQLPITIMSGMLNEAIRGGYDCVMPRHLDTIEPLPSVWNRRALDVILLSIKSERASLRRVAARMNTGYFDYNGSPDEYTGFNTPGEYATRGLYPKQE